MFVTQLTAIIAILIIALFFRLINLQSIVIISFFVVFVDRFYSIPPISAFSNLLFTSFFVFLVVSSFISVVGGNITRKSIRTVATSSVNLFLMLLIARGVYFWMNTNPLISAFYLSPLIYTIIGRLKGTFKSNILYLLGAFVALHSVINGGIISLIFISFAGMFSLIFTFMLVLSRDWMSYEVPLEKLRGDMIPAEIFYFDKKGNIQRVSSGRNIFAFLKNLFFGKSIPTNFDLTSKDRIELLKKKGYDKIRVQRKIRPEIYLFLAAFLNLIIYHYFGSSTDVRSIILP